MKGSYYFPPSQTRYSDGTKLVSPRPATGGSPAYFNATGTKNNYRSSSAHLQQLNSVINALDGKYQTLTTAEKSSWDAAAAAMLGGQLCGCNYSTLNGQKVHRGTNLWLIMQGQAEITTAPSTLFWQPDYLVTMWKQTSPPYGSNLIFFYGSADAGDYAVNFRLGLGLQTPIILLPAPAHECTLVAGDPSFAALWALPTPIQLGYCLSYASGLPITSGTVYFYTLP